MGRDKRRDAINKSADSLRASAVAALESHETWSRSASDQEMLSPVQFLAIVLWMLSPQGSDMSEAQEGQIVRVWGLKLADATAKRCATLRGGGAFRDVVPFDPVTLLELEVLRVSSLDGWILSVGNVDAWIQSLGHAAICNDFFVACGHRGNVAAVTHLQSVPLAGAEPKTWGALVKFRNEYPQTEWTPEQKCIAAAEAKRRKDAPGAKGVAAAMAKELNVTVSRFNDLIRTANESGKRAMARGNVA